MAPESGLRARLGRTFLLQAAFIGAAAVISVFLASALLEGVLIRQALRDEAAHFLVAARRRCDVPTPGYGQSPRLHRERAGRSRGPVARVSRPEHR
jgi:hypothetical protein